MDTATLPPNEIKHSYKILITVTAGCGRGNPAIFNVRRKVKQRISMHTFMAYITTAKKDVFFQDPIDIRIKFKVTTSWKNVN